MFPWHMHMQIRAAIAENIIVFAYINQYST